MNWSLALSSAGLCFAVYSAVIYTADFLKHHDLTRALLEDLQWAKIDEETLRDECLNGVAWEHAAKRAEDQLGRVEPELLRLRDEVTRLNLVVRDLQAGQPELVGAHL